MKWFVIDREWLRLGMAGALVILALALRFLYIRPFILVSFWLCFLCFIYFLKESSSKKQLELSLLLVLACLFISGDKAWVRHYASASSPDRKYEIVVYSAIWRGGFGKDADGYAQLHSKWRILEEGDVVTVNDIGDVMWEKDWVGVGNQTWQLP
jgi:hypothetical protein